MASVIDDPLFLALREGGSLTDDALEAMARAFLEAAANPALLAEKLQPIGVLTRYQHKKIQLGRSFELIFGDYLVLNKIGEGGMGKVYQAVQRRLGRQVALKVVRTQLLSNKTVMIRYEREARAAQQLDHPNIVKLIDAGEVGGKYFLAMEYIDGSDLSRLVKENGPLPYPEAAEYVRQAALGLQHAHDKRFIHRDIKPSNLLVYGTRATVGTSWTASVKILDMGLVRSLTDEEDPDHTDLTRDGTVVGTPDYMAPEQAKNSSDVDSRADLYALGCTLYYLIRGQAPFPKGNPIDKLIAHQIEPVPDLRAGRDDLPPMLGDVVARLMRKRPEERYQTAREVAEALAPFTPDALTFDLSGVMGISAFSFDPVDPGEQSTRQGIITTPRPVATPVATPAPLPGQRPSTPMRTPSAMRLEKPPVAKLIPKPMADDDGGKSSDNLPAVRKKSSRGDSGESSKSRRLKKEPAKRRFPLIPVVITVAVVLLLVIAAVIISRSKKVTPPTTEAIAPTADAATSTHRTVAELLPNDTAAVMVYHPKSYFERSTLRSLAKTHQMVEMLSKRYRFDPRKFERGVVAFQADPNIAVASGEGSFLTPDWLKGFQKPDITTNFADGSTKVQFWNGLLADRNHGLVLPKPEVYSISHDHAALAELKSRGTGSRTGPSGVSPALLEAIVQSEAAPPLVFFAAAGTWQLPAKAWRKGDNLAAAGVDLLILTLRLERQFQIELTLIGKDKATLTDFVKGLPARYDAANMQLKPLLESLAAKPPTIEPHPAGFRLAVATEWDWDTFHATIEKILTPVVVAKKPKDEPPK